MLLSKNQILVHQFCESRHLKTPKSFAQMSILDQMIHFGSSTIRPRGHHLDSHL
jgi:hypothetical protein